VEENDQMSPKTLAHQRITIIIAIIMVESLSPWFFFSMFSRKSVCLCWLFWSLLYPSLQFWCLDNFYRKLPNALGAFVESFESTLSNSPYPIPFFKTTSHY